MGSVVITGVGLVTPLGIGREAVWAALLAGQSGVRRISQFDPSGLPVQIGAEVVDYDAKQHVKPRKSLKVMCREIQMAFGAAEMAWTDAGLADGAVDPERLGVVLGSDFIYGEIDELIAPYRACIVDGRFDFSRWGQHALGEMYPLWMLKYLPNMAACHIGIARDARGPNNSITLGEVSSLLALIEAQYVIERGAADVLLVGGVSSRLQPTALVYRTSDQLSHRNDDPARASRPFDAQRDGMVNGEAAAMLVVESREHAERRGARIMAEVAATSNCFQPDMPNGPLAPGDAIARSLASALERAALAPAQLGFVSAHGVATRDRDRTEAQAIAPLIGAAPVTAPKSYFGNPGASSGALELALAALALEHGQVPATLNYEHPDPECPLHIVAGAAAPLRAPTAAVLSHNTLGQAAAVVLRAH